MEVSVKLKKVMDLCDGKIRQQLKTSQERMSISERLVREDTKKLIENGEEIRKLKQARDNIERKP